MVLLLLTATAGAQDQLERVTDSNHGFAVTVPTMDWNRTNVLNALPLDRPDQLGLSLVHKHLDWLASMVVTIESGRINLPLTSAGLASSMPTFPPELNARVQSVEFVKVDGYNAVKLVIDVHLPNVPRPQRQWQYVLPAGNKAFHLMFTAAPEQFSQLEPTFLRVVDSFDWTEGPFIKLGSGTMLDGVVRNTLIVALPLAVIAAFRLMRRRSQPQGAAEPKAAGPALSGAETDEARRTYARLPTHRLEELLRDAQDLRPGAADLVREELERRRVNEGDQIQ